MTALFTYCFWECELLFSICIVIQMNAIERNTVLDTLRETLQQVHNGTVCFVTERCEKALRIIDHVLPAGQKVLNFIDEHPVVTFIVVGTVVVGLVYFCGGISVYCYRQFSSDCIFAVVAHFRSIEMRLDSHVFEEFTVWHFIFNCI